MIVGIGDTPGEADDNARAGKEIEARNQTMAKLIAGHAVEVEYNNDPKKITIRVGEFVFSDLRDEYPSASLVAQVSLAVDAAKFNPDAFKIPDFDAEDLKRFDPATMLTRRQEQKLAANDADLTAAVNARRRARSLTEAERKARGIF